MKTNDLLKFAATVSLISFVSQSQASISCQKAYSQRDTSTQTAVIRSKIREEKQSVFDKYKELNERGNLDSILTDKTVAIALNDVDVPLFGERLESILLKMSKEKSSPQDFYFELRKILKNDGIPAKLIEKGIKEHNSGKPESLYRLLGSLTIQETREMYVGVSEGLNYTKDSLLGKYIQETGAKAVIRSLPRVTKSDVEAHNIELEKLVVTVSAESFETWKKYFGKKTMFSSFAHGAIAHNGKAYDVWGKKKDLPALYPLTPLPLALLKPSEAERMNRYLELTTKPRYQNWAHDLKQPWRLEEYCMKGAFQCCTNFIGNIPIGDKLVNEYYLPRHPGVEKKPHKLKSWTKTEDNKDLALVWTVPGHEQLSSVLGQIDANIEGEFASPGWVIQTLMLSTNNERVPVVFVFAEDHRVDLPEVLNLRYENPW